MMTAAEVAAALRGGARVADAAFDALFPAAHGARAATHATPIAIGRQVCALLGAGEKDAVLDVGSGIGKMCLVGALVGPARWTGVEKHAGMVRIATRMAAALGVADRATFVHAHAAQLDWRPYAGVYLYNPLAEAVFAERDVGRAEVAHHADVTALEAALATLRAGARVVTYYGFGGDFPAGFELEEVRPVGDDALCSWIRAG